MKVICTKADDINNYLTKGKLYIVEDQNDVSYFITDDTGKIAKYSKARFQKQFEALKSM